MKRIIIEEYCIRRYLNSDGTGIRWIWTLDVDSPTREYTTFDYTSGDQPPRNWTTILKLSNRNHPFKLGIWKICAMENHESKRRKNSRQKDS